ncbi:hypothetical protein [Paraburkholderia susongensis]|nr:hypothetical protein [Paraburkholderia susongensis]
MNNQEFFEEAIRTSDTRYMQMALRSAHDLEQVAVKFIAYERSLIMGSLGIAHWLIVLAIVALVFGRIIVPLRNNDSCM